MAIAVYECVNCKGALEYTPGTASMSCPYCGTVNELPEPPRVETFVELDYEAALASFEVDSLASIEVITERCPGCGADVTIPPDEETHECEFCGTPVVAQSTPHKAMEPQYLLPFTVDKATSRNKYREWLSTRRFAPNALKQRARLTEPLRGIYLPHWTYDSATSSSYTGERGVYYYESVQVRDKDGNVSTKQVRRTRWYPASGHVKRAFDDVLVPASESVPRKLLDRFRSWDLSKMIGFDRQYFAGFAAESYTVDLRAGLERAKDVMNDVIAGDVRRDIGGDTQRIHSIRTSYSNITFKYVVLPIWAATYRFGEKMYSVVVNGQTGEVQGERPISWIKVALLVLGIAAVAAGAWLAYTYFGGGS